MPDRIIPERLGIEVFVNQSQTITIAQNEPGGDEPTMVIVHPDDVDMLIRFLQETKVEAKEIAAAAAEDQG